MESALETETPDLALTSRYLDFWLLGGCSLLVWAVLFFLQDFRKATWAIDHQFEAAAAAFSVLSLFVNYPHFMASYKIAYGRGWRFIRRHWFCLIAVPLILVLGAVVGYFGFGLPVDDSPAVLAINSFCERIGGGVHLEAPSLGLALASLANWVMALTVGWHYSKQVFGCMLVYARYDGYPIDRLQRALLRVSLLWLGWLGFFFAGLVADTDFSAGRKYGLTAEFVQLRLPRAFAMHLELGAYAAAIGVAYFVFYRNYQRHKQRPSANVLVSWFAYQIWTLPLFHQELFSYWAVPFFHSLQYLPFVQKMETSRAPLSERSAQLRYTALVLGLIVAGFLGFELVPDLLDHFYNPVPQLSSNLYFLIWFPVGINIHHFFMDSVIWRMDDPAVKAGLFKPELS